MSRWGEPKEVPFKPTPADEDAFTQWVIEQARELAPGSVDEAVDHVLDNAINARANQWVAQLNSEFVRHTGKLQYRYRKADADVTGTKGKHSPDTHRVVETETARNSAALRLRGEDEKAAWSEPGHPDPTMLAGRPRGRYVYVAALVAAAAADLVAFYQVIQLVLGNSNLLSMILVVGFTGTALGLAHFTGTMFRDRMAGAKWIRIFMVVVAAVVWIALGFLAFWVRLHSSTSGSGGSFNPSVTGGGSGAGTGSVSAQGTIPGAALFAGLYAATGVIAVVGAYLTHNPLHAAFTRAVSEHRAAAKRHATSGSRLKMAEAEREFYEGQLAAARLVRDEAEQARRAKAEELKQLARLEIVKRLRDVSLTDAFMREDNQPFRYRPFPN
jgi:hypothetical protein